MTGDDDPNIVEDTREQRKRQRGYGGNQGQMQSVQPCLCRSRGLGDGEAVYCTEEGVDTEPRKSITVVGGYRNVRNVSGRGRAAHQGRESKSQLDGAEPSISRVLLNGD